MATGGRRTGGDGNNGGGKKVAIWLIIAAVVLLLVLLFVWLFDFSGDVEGGDVEITPPDVNAEIETPGVDVEGGQAPDVDVDVEGGDAPDVDVTPAQ